MNHTTPSPSPPPTHSSPAQGTPHSVAAGAKRKRSSGSKFYAVKLGFQPGVYYNWNDCLAQVTGYKGAVFQSFPTLEEANAFLTGTRLPGSQNTASSGADNTRFYGVQRGHKPGVYTDWAKAQEQIRGFVRPKYKKFSTRVEAEEFVQSGQEQPSTSVSISQVKELPGSAGLTSDNPKDDLGFDLEPGTGPLPPGAEDGFDPNVLFDPTTGRIVYKTKEQKTATKTRPTGSPPIRNVSEPLKGNRQTNQRAELFAILRALDIAPRHRDVTIFTDSRYAIDCVTVWYIKWRRNKWMTADHKPVENKDLVESILVKIEERNELKVKTLFQWVKGHNRDHGNEEADRLAVNGARRGVTEKAEALAVAQNIADEGLEEEFQDDLN
ncbi:putative ribonuclease H [Paecilomyces variotii]|uniref:ribonuclease H n=1 Tax=Byssochlamys spectabilis TaxID=264951 RepID=A0A443I2B3_BYSSP|nr:putative ribonuclease H [Paecilomyces variotii]RWQ98203.1 putative ribonuclease H [Paecilomyces variotii]